MPSTDRNQSPKKYDDYLPLIKSSSLFFQNNQINNNPQKKTSHHVK